MTERTLKKIYYKIWWEVIREFNLSPIEVLTICLIDGLSRQKGWCYASKIALAKTLNVSPQTIYSTINELITKGLLVKSDKKLEGYKTSLFAPTEKWRNLVNYLSNPLTDTL